MYMSPTHSHSHTQSHTHVNKWFSVRYSVALSLVQFCTAFTSSWPICEELCNICVGAFTWHVYVPVQFRSRSVWHNALANFCASLTCVLYVSFPISSKLTCFFAPFHPPPLPPFHFSSTRFTCTQRHHSHFPLFCFHTSHPSNEHNKCNELQHSSLFNFFPIELVPQWWLV